MLSVAFVLARVDFAPSVTLTEAKASVKGLLFQKAVKPLTFIDIENKYRITL